ncbi:MAG TPA: aminotransferase class V-fold PLP-dependent enzyme [Terriglobia bacterium]|nr:aminotransferase class V-fold PLP-dependent enzyme [Terriglobia bacterium]
MEFKNQRNRRSFLSKTGLLAGSLLGSGRLWAKGRTGGAGGFVPESSAKITRFGESGDVYRELGVTPVINGQGTMTMLGGSVIPTEVEEVMAAAARHYVNIPDLEVAAGKRIARMLKLPKGFTGLVTSGAAGAMTCGYAGVLTGDNPDFIQRLPDLTGMKSEVIIQKSHRYAFDHQIRATGVKLVEIETREDLHQAISPRTAMMHFTNFANAQGRIKVDEWVKLAMQYHLPCFNDAAADTPPVSHLWDYVNMGYDLVTFSGGKAIRGPQCAGLLLGREDLIHYALINNSPFEDTLGRGQKVGKEEIVGMVKALELFLNADHDALTKEWWRRLDTISHQVTKVAGVSTAYYVPDIANHVPTMQINWDPRKINLTPHQASDALEKSDPSIVLGRSRMGLEMNSFMLQPGEDQIIGKALLSLFRAHSA